MRKIIPGSDPFSRFVSRKGWEINARIVDNTDTGPKRAFWEIGPPSSPRVYLPDGTCPRVRPLSGPQREFCSRYPLAVSLASASRLLAPGFSGYQGRSPWLDRRISDRSILATPF